MEQWAAISTADRNNLPDSAFAYIEPGGTKDASGKTTPRSKRHFPVHDAAHVRNALARIAQGAQFGEQALPKVHAAAKKFGIDVSGSASAPRDPKWEQRRKRWAGSLIGHVARRSLALARGDVEIRAKPNGTGGTDFEFNGYAATFYEPFEMFDKWGDPYKEDVWDMAFQETLSRRDLDTPFLVGHNDADIPMARTRSGTLRLATDTRGLHTHAPALDGRNDQVRRLASAVERGDIDEMSIGFVTRGQKWSEDWEQRHLTSIDLHRGDVSVVALAANPATRGVSMVALPTESLSRAAAERRAAVNGAAGWDHDPMTGTHSHPHNNFGSNMANPAGVHEHDHSHDDDADHDHMHPAVGPNSHSAGHPHEHRGNPVDQGLGDAPDYNPDQEIRCMSQNCTTPGGALNGIDARHCAQCGAPLYGKDFGGDALVRLDQGGVPAMQEEQGSVATLALKRRQLELLALCAPDGL